MKQLPTWRRIRPVSGRQAVGAGADALIGGIAGGGKGATIGSRGGGCRRGGDVGYPRRPGGDPERSLLSFTLRSAISIK